MSDPVVPPAGGGSTSSPALPVTPQQQPTQQAAAPAAAAAPTPVSMTSDQLKERLGEAGNAATKALLKELGFKSPDDAKAALKKLADLELATKTDAEKRQAELDALKPRAQRADELETQFTALVEEQFKTLPETVQKAIDAEAEGDPEARLILMRVLRASGLGAAPASPAQPAVPAPANVSPSPAPAPSAAPSKFDEWQAMARRSPTLGDIFYQTHQREIERTRPASA